MKYLVLVIFLMGCYSQKKASRQLTKVDAHYPALVARKAELLYPAKITTDSVYLVKWRDSIIDIIIKEIDTLRLIDTIYTNCDIYKTRTNNLLEKLKLSYKTIPPKIVTITDSAQNYLYQSKINSLEINVNKYRLKYESWLKVTICILILLIISLVVQILRSYFKK